MTLYDPTHRLVSQLPGHHRSRLRPARRRLRHHSPGRVQPVPGLGRRSTAPDDLRHASVTLDDDRLVSHSNGREVATSTHLVLGMGTVAYIPEFLTGLDPKRVLIADNLNHQLGELAGLDPMTQWTVVGSGRPARSASGRCSGPGSATSAGWAAGPGSLRWRTRPRPTTCTARLSGVLPPVVAGRAEPAGRRPDPHQRWHFPGTLSTRPTTRRGCAPVVSPSPSCRPPAGARHVGDDIDLVPGRRR